MNVGSLFFNIWDGYNYNNAANTERMIELPIAMWFINHFNSIIIEVGAVSPYYWQIIHPVFDPYDSL